MTSLNWVRVDSSIASNHKVIALLSEKGGDHAFCVYIFALGHCASQGTDGFIPSAALGLIHGRPRDGFLLTEAGLWHEIPGGFQVHDWLDFQPSDADSKARSEKAKKAAHARWAKRQAPALKAVK